MPCLENDTVLAYYVFDNYQPIIMCLANNSYGVRAIIAYACFHTRISLVRRFTDRNIRGTGFVKTWKTLHKISVDIWILKKKELQCGRLTDETTFPFRSYPLRRRHTQTYVAFPRRVSQTRAVGVVKLAFHGADTDILATILARMSMSVSASWNASFTVLSHGGSGAARHHTAPHRV